MRIELADLCKEFDGTSVLKGLDFDDDVTTLAIIGPSGGGKSTLLRILGGLTAPTSGAVRVDGETVSYDEATLPAYRAKLGFVFQQGGLFQHLSAVENIAMPLREVHGIEASTAQPTPWLRPWTPWAASSWAKNSRLKKTPSAGAAWIEMTPPESPSAPSPRGQRPWPGSTAFPRGLLRSRWTLYVACNAGGAQRHQHLTRIEPWTS